MKQLKLYIYKKITRFKKEHDIMKDVHASVICDILTVHPCESKIAPALNFYAYFLRLNLIFFLFLHIKLALRF